MSGPWEKYRSSGPWDKYRGSSAGQSNAIAQPLSAPVPGTVNTGGVLDALQPGYTPPPETSDSRIGDGLKPYFGGRNPVAEGYDAFVKPFVEEPNAATKAFQDSRGLAERAGDAATFFASMPVRLATQGKAGIGDAVGAIAPETGESLSRAERDFVKANEPYLEAIGDAGEATAGIVPLRTMGSVGPARLPTARSTSDLADDAAKARSFNAPSDSKLAARRQLRQDFEASDIKPFGPAFSDGMQGYAKNVGEQPFVGSPIKNAARNTFAKVKDRRDDIARRLGPGETLEDAGLTADDALRRFKDARPQEIVDDGVGNLSDARLSEIIRRPTASTSLKTKQSALYERAARYIPEELRNGGVVPGTKFRMMGGPRRTREVLSEIVARNKRMTNQSGKGAAFDGFPVAGGQLRLMLDAIANKKWTGNLQTLRNMRSEIRRLASGVADTERNTLKASDLQRLQSALTQDMVSLLESASTKATGPLAQNFERAIKSYRQADRYTRGAMERMERIERLFNADTPEKLARAIERATMSKGRGDLQTLRILRKTLRPEELDDVAASVLRSMGTPTGSAARGITGDLGFSVNTFLTNWQNMTPEARALVFRSQRDPKAFADLERLMRVVQSLGDYEAMANTSKTAVSQMSAAIVGGAGIGAFAMPVTTFMTLLGARGLSNFLVSPQYVRWMTRAADLERLSRRRMTPRLQRQMNEHWASLRPMLNDDPAMAAEVSRALALAVEQQREASDVQSGP